MKVKVIARSAKREINGADPKLARRNLDPKHHPFAAAREYQRAVVAAKLDRMMAKRRPASQRRRAATAALPRRASRGRAISDRAGRALDT